ncbi:hypothetical protein OTK49_00725 [Vibrio coralliirubri]|uniref:hypothetical protein n=1 Tax=Vibrio coralliirubri TaxID=1516159 RepID=UPI002284A701|nr:hypothetical protein [Vibrio coralliirubri]MCY9861058.1 hypothetical protein [Vibrio coralliirubri]
MKSEEVIRKNSGAPIFRFSYKGGFKVDSSNSRDFIDAPPTSDELSVMYDLVVERDYLEWLVFRLLFSVFFAIGAFALFAQISLTVGELGIKGLLAEIAITLAACLALVGVLSHFISALLVGVYFPIGVTIDGITYLSHLTDVEPITDEEMQKIDSSQFSEVGFQYFLNVERIGRPLARFETYMLPELGSFREDYMQH